MLYYLEKFVAFLLLLLRGGLVDEAEAAFAFVARAYAAARDSSSPRVRSYFTRPDLLWPHESPWAQAWRTRSDMGLTEITRLDVAAFERLHSKLPSEWIEHRAKHVAGRRRPGRPNMLDSYAVLALTLCWYCSTCQLKQMELIFGVPHSVLSRDLDDGKIQLMLALAHCPEARISWPQSPEEFERLSELIRIAYYDPEFPGKWFGWVDGLRLPVYNPSRVADQSEMYNGWLHATCCENVLVFSPDGKIIWVTRNHPGKQNDIGTIACLRFLMLDREKTPAGFSLLGDVGFAASYLEGIIDTKSPPKTYRVNAHRYEAFGKWVTTSRQAVEWGMRVLQSNWKRVTVPLPTDSIARLNILDTVFMLHNYLTHHCGHNQIRSVYIEASLRGGLQMDVEAEE